MKKVSTTTSQLICDLVYSSIYNGTGIMAGVFAPLFTDDAYCPLRDAARRGQIFTVCRLIDHGKSDLRAHMVGAALEDAAEYGYERLVRVLIRKYPKDWNSINNGLLLAADKGHSDIVRYLISAGADIHYAADAPLRRAEKNGHTEVVKILKSA